MSSPTQHSWNWSSLETAHPLVSCTYMCKHLLYVRIVSSLVLTLIFTFSYVPTQICLHTSELAGLVSSCFFSRDWLFPEIVWSLNNHVIHCSFFGYMQQGCILLIIYHWVFTVKLTIYQCSLDPYLIIVTKGPWNTWKFVNAIKRHESPWMYFVQEYIENVLVFLTYNCITAQASRGVYSFKPLYYSLFLWASVKPPNPHYKNSQCCN